MLFLIFSICIFNFVAYIIPKRTTGLEMYASSLFALLFAIITDKFFDLKYNLYGYFGPGLEWQTVVTALGIYPACNVIFLNYYPFCGSFIRKAVYIFGWVIFSIIFEWLSIKSGYFYYNGWKLYYSAMCYPVIYVLLAWNLCLIRKLKAKETK